MSRFEAAIFDLDGVIADTARSHSQAWKKLADEIGVPFDAAINERLKGVPRLASLDIILQAAGRIVPHGEKVELSRRKNDHYLELVANVTSADLLPGARAAIEGIRQAGLKTALASASRNAVTLIGNLGIGDLLDYVADANFVQKHKPDPEIFLMAAKGLEVTPARCIAFEDAVAGIEAIRAAGMYAVGIGDPVILAGADLVLPGLSGFSIACLEKAGRTQTDA